MRANDPACRNAPDETRPRPRGWSIAVQRADSRPEDLVSRAWRGGMGAERARSDGRATGVEGACGKGAGVALACAAGSEGSAPHVFTRRRAGQVEVIHPPRGTDRDGVAADPERRFDESGLGCT